MNLSVHASLSSRCVRRLGRSRDSRSPIETRLQDSGELSGLG